MINLTRITGIMPMSGSVRSNAGGLPMAQAVKRQLGGSGRYLDQLTRLNPERESSDPVACVIRDREAHVGVKLRWFRVKPRQSQPDNDRGVAATISGRCQVQRGVSI
jgi:hypothetical protein